MKHVLLHIEKQRCDISSSLKLLVTACLQQLKAPPSTFLTWAKELTGFKANPWHIGALHSNYHRISPLVPLLILKFLEFLLNSRALRKFHVKYEKP